MEIERGKTMETIHNSINKTRDAHKNGAIYKDGTATAAIGKVDREMAKKRKDEAYNAIDHIYSIANRYGFRIADPIALIDMRTEKVYAEDTYTKPHDEEV